MRARVAVRQPAPVAAAPRPAPATAHPVLRLQRTAGNQAVQRVLAVQRDARADAERTERFRAAYGRADYDGMSAALNQGDQRWMLERLRSLPEGVVRRLDDTMRAAGEVNTTAHRMVTAVLTETVVTARRPLQAARPGAAYGVIEGHAAEVHDGRIVPGGANVPASYKFEATFMPDPAMVHATLIEFVQVARVVSTTASAPDPVGVQVPTNAGANGPNRQTAEHARIDRAPGQNLGWLGRNNAGGIQPGRLRPWTPGSTQPAYVNDTPSRSVPNVDFHYETAAICRSGPDAGTVYATVRWGFTIDANMKIVPREPVYFNKESPEFDLSVAFWNAEASSPGSTQQPLPTNVR